MTDPWFVTDVRLCVEKQRVDIDVEHTKGAKWCCPVCGKPVRLYDHAERRTWRHLDSCQFQTFLHARIPRVACPEHGIRNTTLPWGERGSRFTLLMESLIIDVLQECQSISGACHLLGISWDEAIGVMTRAVRRGQSRKEQRPLKHIGADEKSVKRGHHYVTVVCDLEESSVEYVAEGRDASALSAFYQQLPPSHLQAIEAVALDMCAPFIRATLDHVPQAQEKIVFDRFHIMKHANEAMDRVRQGENRRLSRAGDVRRIADEGACDVHGASSSRGMGAIYLAERLHEAIKSLDPPASDLPWRINDNVLYHPTQGAIKLTPQEATMLALLIKKEGQACSFTEFKALGILDARKAKSRLSRTLEEHELEDREIVAGQLSYSLIRRG